MEVLYCRELLKDISPLTHEASSIQSTCLEYSNYSYRDLDGWKLQMEAFYFLTDQIVGKGKLCGRDC